MTQQSILHLVVNWEDFFDARLFQGKTTVWWNFRLKLHYFDFLILFSVGFYKKLYNK